MMEKIQRLEDAIFQIKMNCVLLRLVEEYYFNQSEMPQFDGQMLFCDLCQHVTGALEKAQQESGNALKDLLNVHGLKS